MKIKNLRIKVLSKYIYRYVEKIKIILSNEWFGPQLFKLQRGDSR